MFKQIKKMSVLFFVATSMLMFSCSKEVDEEGNNQSNSNPMNGTKWVYSRSQTNCVVIEFISDNQIQTYSAYTNTLAPSDRIAQGTYSFSDNNITFSMDGVWVGMLQYKYTTGYVSGSLLEVEVNSTGGVDGLKWSFVKQ